MKQTLTTHSEDETVQVAGRVAGWITPGSVLTLSGDLGSGKTRFAKGVASGLGIDPEAVDSPTFTLLQEYRSPSGLMLYHFDFYRLKTVQEAVEIGAEEYFYGDGISIVEWPDRVEELLPESAIRIGMEIAGLNSRTITIEYPTVKAVP